MAETQKGATTANVYFNPASDFRTSFDAAVIVQLKHFQNDISEFDLLTRKPHILMSKEAYYLILKVSASLQSTEQRMAKS